MVASDSPQQNRHIYMEITVIEDDAVTIQSKNKKILKVDTKWYLLRLDETYACFPLKKADLTIP